jgi:hypothetical protein
MNAHPFRTEAGTNKPSKIMIRQCELAEVESCLESVVVPGELLAWANELLQACEAEGSALRREISKAHAENLAKLSAANSDQSQHAAQLEAEDAEILRRFDEFESKVRRLQERAALAGAREDNLEEGIRSIVEDGLALVIRVRKQERALSTWLSEAFQRDTGVGD